MVGIHSSNSVVATDIKPKEYWFQDFENVENYYSTDMKDISNCRKVSQGVDYVFNMACNMGGMGFIEETGAAQHYRDARILPIYEGTTAIQANDLVFRKTIRDNGAAVNSLFDEIDQDMAALETHPDAAISAAAKSVIEANKTARTATAGIIGSANSPRRPAAAASNYLMLLGTLSGVEMGLSLANIPHQKGGVDAAMNMLKGD